jgi:hypothetical protein
MADLLGKPSFEKLEIDNWIELFKYFVEFYDGTGKIIFIFDEFPYLIESIRKKDRTVEGHRDRLTAFQPFFTGIQYRKSLQDLRGCWRDSCIH